MHKLDMLLASYRTDPEQLDPLLLEVTATARRVALSVDRTVDVDDIAQQVTVAIWANLSQLEDKIAGLVVSMAKGRAIDATRSPMHTATDTLPEAEKRERHNSMYAARVRRIAVQVLGEQVVDLIHRGYTVSEIAILVGVPASTISSRMKKIRRSTIRR